MRRGRGKGEEREEEREEERAKHVCRLNWSENSTELNSLAALADKQCRNVCPQYCFLHGLPCLVCPEQRVGLGLRHAATSLEVVRRGGKLEHSRTLYGTPAKHCYRDTSLGPIRPSQIP